MPPGHGESAISSLYQRFKLSSTSVSNASRHLEEAGQRILQDLRPALNCTHVIPSSTAECERGFIQSHEHNYNSNAHKNSHKLGISPYVCKATRAAPGSNTVTTWLPHDPRARAASSFSRNVQLDRLGKLLSSVILLSKVSL